MHPPACQVCITLQALALARYIAMTYPVQRRPGGPGQPQRRRRQEYGACGKHAAGAHQSAPSESILPHGLLTEMGHGPHMGRLGGSSGWRAYGIIVRGPLPWRMRCESRCGHGAASVGEPGLHVLGALAILLVAGRTVAAHMHEHYRSKSAHTQSNQQPSCLCECVCYGVLVVLATVTDGSACLLRRLGAGQHQLG
jgi:hypothetical protein